MKILCYGDSNTYGWDPRHFFGGRYERVWTDILEEAGHQVYVDGMPGRQIPFRKYPLEATRAALTQLTDHVDLAIIMMGSNDIDATLNPDTVRSRMETLLKAFLSWDLADRILLVGPPENRATRENMLAGRQMNEAFRDLAEVFGLDYVDARDWDLKLAFDHCHLTEEDQEVFAAEILKVL